MKEELHILLSESPLYKILAYRKVFCRGSINDSLKVINICCQPINYLRKEYGGRFRVDQLVLEGVSYGTKEIMMKLEDILDEMREEQDIDDIRTYSSWIGSGRMYRREESGE